MGLLGTQGKKMSKSTGNVVDPLDIIDEYGADACLQMQQWHQLEAF